MHTSCVFEITLLSGSQYAHAKFASINSFLTIGLAFSTLTPTAEPTNIFPSQNPFKYALSLAYFNKSLSFCDLILSSSTKKTAVRSPKSGILIIGTGSNGKTHSSAIPYFSLKGCFYQRSLNVAQSSGESDGTDVTIPVPFSIEIVIIGRAYTFS